MIWTAKRKRRSVPLWTVHKRQKWIRAGIKYKTEQSLTACKEVFTLKAENANHDLTDQTVPTNEEPSGHMANIERPRLHNRQFTPQNERQDWEVVKCLLDDAGAAHTNFQLQQN